MSLPLDTTASLESNRIPNEHISLSAAAITNSGVVTLKNSPFYAQDLNIVYIDGSGAQRTLVRNTDYWLVGQWAGLGLANGGIYAAIFINNPALAGEWYVTYRALGGNVTVSPSQIVQYFTAPGNRSKATASQILPQSSLLLSISSMKDLTTAQSRFAVIPMVISYYLPAAGTTTVVAPSTPTPAGDSSQALAAANQALTLAQSAATTAQQAQSAVAGKFTFPVGGIGQSDLSADVRAALTKATSSLQSVPIAAASSVGGVKVGAGLNIAPDGTLSAQIQSVTIPVTSVNGKTGAVTLVPGDISGLGSAAMQATTAFATAAQGAKADTALQSVPPATASAIGGVKQGNGVVIGGDGTLTVPQASSATSGLVQLAGDLGGTAAAPTVPGLAGKQDRLTAGTTIKTIGGVNPLGSGDIPFPVVTPASINAVATNALGSPNGAASLDATGKVPLSQIPVSLQGALNYQGSWNAITNTPTIVGGAGQKGAYYTVSIAGNTMIDGVNQWNVGDHITFNGSIWEKFDGTASEVISVAGRTGVVALTAADIGGLGTSATQPATAFATSTQGVKADTAVQNVNGKTGTTVTLVASDVGALSQATADVRYATLAQGNKADTALQSVPVATTGTLGGVKQGAGVVIGADGTLSATGSTSPNATTSTPGLVQLTGDLGGTATAPTVPGLAGKQDKLTAGNFKTVGGNTLLGPGDIAFPTITPVGIGAVATTSIGVANGVAGLDSGGKVPLSQLPASMQGAMTYQGGWNAATNSPVIASGAGTKGAYYTVSTAGATLVDGISQWNQGDHIAFNGTLWEKFDGLASEVISVAGRTGVVVLTASDIGGLGTAATQASTAFATAVQGTKADNAVQTVNGKSGTSVTLVAADVGALTQTSADARYATTAQGTKADNAVQTINGLSGTSLTLTPANIGAVSTTLLGAANGVATLDGAGKLPIALLPNSVQGALNYQGSWNASTNTPTLASGTGTKGTYYTVSNAGATNIDGVSQWNQGDHIAFNGTIWEKFDGIASEVITVAGRTGNVTLSTSDISGLGTAATQAAGSFATAAQGAKADTALQSVPVASSSVLGGVKQGSGVTIAGDGTISTSAGNVSVFGPYATMAALNTAYPASPALAGNTALIGPAPHMRVVCDGTKWDVQAIRRTQETRIVTTWADAQTLHDELKAAGGGELHWVPGGVYVPPPGNTLNVDVSSVGLEFNGAFINCSGWWGSTQGTSTTGNVFYCTGTALIHTLTNYQALRRIANGIVYGVFDVTSRGDWGPTAFVFDTKYQVPNAYPGTYTDSSTANCIFTQMKVVGFRRGLEYGSRAYFVRVQNSTISRNWAGIYTQANPIDYAEKNTFTECVIAENRTAVDSTQAGQVYTFLNCSFDYNRQYFNIGLGTKIYMSSCHMETDYGKTGTDTLNPIVITGAATGIWGRQMTILYMGTQPQAWDPFCVMDNASQIFDMEIHKCSGIGRTSYAGSLDCWVVATGNVNPMVRIKVDVNVVSPNDVPSMSWCSETFGARGLLRNGIGWPQGQLVNITAINGTGAQLGNFSTTQGSVSTKNGANMTSIQNNNPGSGSYTARAGNTGNPTIGSITATQGTIVPGQYTVVFSTPTVFSVLKPDGSTLASGTVGTAFSSGGLGFTATAGSTAAAAGDTLYISAGCEYIITYPLRNFAARHAWDFLFNTQAVTSGTPNVKELISAFVPKFNRTSVSFVQAPFYPAYTNASGVNLTAGQNWTYHGWKSHATTFYPSLSFNMSGALCICIDMTGVTGPVYLSHFGYDVISNSN